MSIQGRNVKKNINYFDDTIEVHYGLGPFSYDISIRMRNYGMPLNHPTVNTTKSEN